MLDMLRLIFCRKTKFCGFSFWTQKFNGCGIYIYISDIYYQLGGYMLPSPPFRGTSIPTIEKFWGSTPSTMVVIVLPGGPFGGFPRMGERIFLGGWVGYSIPLARLSPAQIHGAEIRKVFCNQNKIGRCRNTCKSNRSIIYKAETCDKSHFFFFGGRVIWKGWQFSLRELESQCPCKPIHKYYIIW